MSWRLSRLGEAGEKLPSRAWAEHPGNSRRGRRPWSERPAQSSGRPAAKPGSPGCASRVPPRFLSAALRGRVGAAGRWSGRPALSLHFWSAASGSSRGRPLRLGRRLLLHPSLFLPTLSQAAAAAAAAAARGKADSARSHTESSRSRLAALSALASPASSARTSFSWTNLVKQAGIYEWKGDQAQRGERCF